MSEIKKGDLVVVIRANDCGCPDRIGTVFTVTKVIRSTQFRRCQICGDTSEFTHHLVAEGQEKGTVGLNRLRKIDPDQASDREREFDQLSRRNKELA